MSQVLTPLGQRRVNLLTAFLMHVGYSEYAVGRRAADAISAGVPAPLHTMLGIIPTSETRLERCRADVALSHLGHAQSDEAGAHAAAFYRVIAERVLTLLDGPVAEIDALFDGPLPDFVAQNAAWDTEDTARLVGIGAALFGIR